MRMLAALAALALVVTALIGPSAASESPSQQMQEAPAVETGGTIFAFAGTAVTNGYFFPGTMTCNGEDCTSLPPLQIPRGTDIDFVNLDPAAVTNAHQIISFKRKRGRPLFKSRRVNGPGRALMVTSHLKPKVYEYFCSTHYGMYGRIEVVKE
jgi:hypothetical protein